MQQHDTSTRGQALTLFAAGVIPSQSARQPAEEVWTAYHAYHPGAHLDEKRRLLIQRRLRDGYTAEQLIDAVRGCHEDPWYQGDNPRGKAYCDLSLILRDADHVDRFLEMHRNPRRPSSMNGSDTMRMAGGNQATRHAAVSLITRGAA